MDDTHRNFRVLRVLDPTLRMKAQADSNSRSWKDFICREEKRKTAYWRMQGDPETRDPRGSGWGFGFIAFSGGRDVSQVQTEVSWEGKVSP
jgi:hypothetical protein